MLAECLADGAFLRLIEKWLKAGVLDTDGQVLHLGHRDTAETRSSPILANVY
jgi:RNA-directed DNA polymerase